MSGWIKLEKDLESDPRVIRMAKALDRQFCLFERTDGGERRNACALPGVTLVVGALARLWMYADSHARDDDTLDLSTGELDEWIGIPGFCAAMPVDWLTIVDEHTLQLPNFQEHNNTEAKKKALGQKRQEKYRGKHQRGSVTPRNAGASLDQTKTRPDQTKTHSERAHEKPKGGQGESRKAGTDPGGDAGAGGPADSPPLARVRVLVDPHEVLERVRAVYPAGTYQGVTWIHAERCIGKLLDAGESPEAITDAAAKYCAQQDALGKTGSQFVQSPKNFFESGAWRGPFPTPAAPTVKRMRTAHEIAADYPENAA